MWQEALKLGIRDLQQWPSEAELAVELVKATVRQNDHALICVDGRDGSGKTRFSQWLAYRTGLDLVPMDLFLLPDKGLVHDVLLPNFLKSRVGKRRSALVDGVFAAKLLKQWGLSVDAIIRIIRTDECGSDDFPFVFDDYEAEFAADVCIYLPCLGAERADKICHMLGKPSGSGTQDMATPCRFCMIQSDPEQRTSAPW